MMVDGADMQIDGLHRTERPLDFGEGFVTAHRLGGAHLLFRDAGAAGNQGLKT
jgi:hypothetical protein